MATLLAAAASGDIWKHLLCISDASNQEPYNKYTEELANVPNSRNFNKSTGGNTFYIYPTFQNSYFFSIHTTD
jgi:hypothetical protein